jgi:alkaline phosphatase
MRIDRRNVLWLGPSALATAVLAAKGSMAEDRPARLRFGLITDLHYADKPTAGSRHYRDTPRKLKEAADAFAKLDSPIKFVVELGDFIDAAESVEIEKRYLSTIDAQFREISPDRHYVLGNHCVDTLTGAEFLAEVGQKASYYSFDRDGRHFIVLDACYRKDGVPYGRKNFEWSESFVPDHELEFLEQDLKKTTAETIVFAHQRLDVEPPYGVINAPEVRSILEKSGCVRAVFQGHSHKNDHKKIGPIDYVTFVAMVEGPAPESSGYSVVNWYANGSIEIEGFRHQSSRRWRN